MMALLSMLAVNVSVVALIAAAAGFCVKYRLPRPPIGSYTYPDVLFISVVVMLAPLVYLALPTPVVVAVFGCVLLVVVQLVLAPVIGARPGWWTSAGLCLATAALYLLGAKGAVIGLTDALLATGVIGVACLWAQTGMRAGHVAVLAGLLAGYDLVATTLTDVMRDFFDAVVGLPFAPIFVVGGGATPAAIGLGDLLILVLFPLVAGHEFGRRAGLLAAAAGAGATALVTVLFATGLLRTLVPLLTVVGPMILVQFAFWRIRRRHLGHVEPPNEAVSAALRLPVGDQNERPWLAIHNGQIVGDGLSPGLARKSARERGCAALPVIRRAFDLAPVPPGGSSEARRHPSTGPVRVARDDERAGKGTQTVGSTERPAIGRRGSPRGSAPRASATPRLSRTFRPPDRPT